MTRYSIVTLKVGQEAQDPHLALSKFNVKVQFLASDGYKINRDGDVLTIEGRMHVVDVPFSSVLSAVQAADVAASLADLEVLKAAVAREGAPLESALESGAAKRKKGK